MNRQRRDHKILLINASIDGTLSYGIEDGRPKALNNVIGRDPPLGLCYMASILRENGYSDVEIIDAQVLNANLNQLTERVISAEPDIIAISVITFSFLHGPNSRRRLRKELTCLSSSVFMLISILNRFLLTISLMWASLVRAITPFSN